MVEEEEEEEEEAMTGIEAGLGEGELCIGVCMFVLCVFVSVCNLMVHA